MNRTTFQQVAELHAAGIDRGFLATLGVPLLRVLYQAVHESPEGILVVEERDGRVVGFVAGSNGMGPILRGMLRHPVALAGALFPVVGRPRNLAGILEVLRAGRAEQGRDGPALPRAELLSLAVDPRYRRLGIAGSLYRQLQARFLERGIHAFRIVVGDPLLEARCFYEGLGARPAARVEVHRGAGSTIYIHDSEPRQ